jgi:hypothetical protein
MNNNLQSAAVNSLGVLLDCSGSMAKKMGRQTRLTASTGAAAAAFQAVCAKDPECVAWLGAFSDRFFPLEPPMTLGENLDLLLKKLVSLRIAGGTNYRAGLSGAIRNFNGAATGIHGRHATMLSRIAEWLEVNPSQPNMPAKKSSASRKRILLFLSDGEDFGRNPIPLADDLKKQGIEIHTVGVAGQPEDVDEARLKKIASWDIQRNRPFYRFIKDAQLLAEHFVSVSNRLVFRG